MQQASQVKDFCRGKSQAQRYFRFIPLSSLLGNKDFKKKSHITCPILADIILTKEKSVIKLQLNAKKMEEISG